MTAAQPDGTLASVKHGPQNAITRVASALKDCLSDAEVLRGIDDLFNDLGFEFDPEAEEWELASGTGQRRSRAEGFLSTLNLDDPSDRDRLFAAISAKLSDWGEGRGPSPDRLTRLHRTLKAVGYEWNGTDVVMRLLPAVWDHPPEFTTMHRPGIASVSGDRIILDGTTMEEVERYHAATLRKVIPEVNKRVAEQEAAERAKRERAEDDRRAHDESVREAAKRIKFD